MESRTDETSVIHLMSFLRFGVVLSQVLVEMLPGRAGQAQRAPQFYDRPNEAPVVLPVVTVAVAVERRHSYYW